MGDAKVMSMLILMYLKRVLKKFKGMQIFESLIFNVDSEYVQKKTSK